MKHLRRYNDIKESHIHGGITYRYDWAMPKSPIRIEVSNDLNDILLEAKDLGYGIGTGWVETPYAWIGVKLKDKLVVKLLIHLKTVEICSLNKFQIQ